MKNILTLFLVLQSGILTGRSTQDINVSDLPNGLFLLKIQKQGAIFTEKIVIEK